MSLSIEENYNLDVVKAGDEASGNFKESCNDANYEIDAIKYLNHNGSTWEVNTGENGVEKVIESIDGVGTKIQIYTEHYEFLFNKSKNDKLSDIDFFNNSVELWERMLSDLIAMNVDDLRNGEMAVSVTNIIDINHLKGVRGKVFSDSMAKALGNTIRKLGIAMTAGETAVLGEPKKVGKFSSIIEETENRILNRLNNIGKDEIISAGILHDIENILNLAKGDMKISLEEIEFNIGGTGTGIMGNKEKLSQLEVGQSIVYFAESRTKTGIIGPRSNGITAIRSNLDNIAGKGWENLVFEEFLIKIGEEKSSKISDELKKECSGLEMWDIATGKTTVYNPFISKTLLGGMDNEPVVDISSIIHVTGNPGRKISEGLRGRDDLYVDLDITNVKVPQIIEILQSTCDISDELAMGSWNMGIPYTVVCNTNDVDKIIELAKKDGLVAAKIGEIKERDNKEIIGNIKGVGKSKGNIELKK